MYFLGIPCHSYKHFGRFIAPILMDLQECEELAKRNAGNLASDIYGKSYCTKLPLSAIRALAGSIFNADSTKIKDQHLLVMNLIKNY